ncbi:hypothetical protein [Lutispora sp.]|uniref:hypothetical protein n=1 Tax=Lutispora sp. TaxID=2828727 RepID=UPI002B1FC2C2|nr:hypothetical protein [Lutispora sp.]MEA4964175.1 hypothetical protein [Lutispora sp.]
MQVNHNQAKILFSAYAAIIAILFSLWFYFENIALLVSFESLLMILCIWLFVKARYFIALSKRNSPVKSIEILIARIYSIVMFGASCLAIYVNITYL